MHNELLHIGPLTVYGYGFIDVYKRQIQCKVPIIFLTASPDYAIESYEVQASGYLLK